MKIYHNISRKLARQKIGNVWQLYQFAAKLKPGDLIHTCRGYNEKIKEIYPRWTTYGLSKGCYVADFSIITELGNCSLLHCCEKPKTDQEIIQNWNYYKSPQGIDYLNKVDPERKYTQNWGELAQNLNQI